MDSLHVLFIIGAFLVVALLLVVFILPTDIERKKKQKRQPNPAESADKEKSLEKQLHHVENAMAAVRKQLESYQQQERQWQKELLVEKAKVEKLQEKLNQERQWQEKEVEKFDKKTTEVNNLKKDLAKLQDSFNQEHSRNLHLENDIRDIKEKSGSVSEERRALEIEKDQLKTKLDVALREIIRLKKESEFLSQQKEDTSWIAKSEYLKLEKKLKDAEEQLQKIKNTKP